MSKQPNKTCEYCGKQYYVIPAKVQRSRYCCRECQIMGTGLENSKRAEFTKTCPICQSQFSGRKKTSNYCSKECSKVAQFSGFRQQHQQSAEQRHIVHCAYCGKEKSVPPCRDNGRTFFCDQEHKWLYSKQPVHLICEICATPFETVRFWAEHEVEGRRPKYCSKACHKKGMSIKRTGEGNPLWVEKIVIICLECGSPFEAIPALFENGRKFCSKKCSSKYLSHTFRGESHWNWIHGKTPDFGLAWKRISRSIRKRDGYCCQVCGLVHKGRPALHVHHIIPRRLWNGNIPAANHPDNLITLCGLCHKQVEIGKIALPANMIEKAQSIFNDR